MKFFFNKIWNSNHCCARTFQEVLLWENNKLRGSNTNCTSSPHYVADYFPKTAGFL